MVVTECPSTKLRGAKTAINYYAGFSEAFVDYAIDNSALKKDSFVLDPLVLQDSRYKDLDLKISEIFAESLEMKGLQIIDQSKYMSEGFNYLRGNKEINEVVFRCRKK